MDKVVEPLTDDAELAKVLEGMQDPAPSVAAAPTGLNFEETPALPTPMADPAPASDTAPAADTTTETISDSAPIESAIPTMEMPQAPVEASTVEMPSPMAAPTPTPAEPELTIPTIPSIPAAADPALESIKKDALEQLRPLVDKLDLEPSEKFDTLLLIIRSTDDKSLVQQAYESAKLIPDESKRAEALLDIIKEIDYFSNTSVSQPQL